MGKFYADGHSTFWPVARARNRIALKMRRKAAMFLLTFPFLVFFLFPSSQSIAIPSYSSTMPESNPPLPGRISPSSLTSASFTQKWTLENIARISKATDEATIAYFVQVSDQTLPLIPRLLARLHHPQNYYAVHFDKKIPDDRVITIVAKIKANPAYSNVIVMERDPVTYRGITMVLNNLAAMSELIDVGGWDYFINLSGSDYPLVSPSIQRKFLAMPYVKEHASNFFILSPKSQWNQSLAYRFKHITVDTALGMSERPQDSQLIVLDQKTPLFAKLNYDFIKGEGWLIITRKACKFMIESNFARKMLVSMAYSQDPSEHFYISALWNHPQFNRTIIPHSLRTVYWKLNGEYSGQHPYVIDKVREKNGSYTIWPWLRISPHWFVRKFSEPDHPMMDWIDNEMSGLGNSVNQSSVDISLQRVETHLHWLYNIRSKRGERKMAPKGEDLWPQR